MSIAVSFNPAASPQATSVWNDVVGPKYARYERIMVESASRHSERIWDRFPIGPGDHVVDVGCGFGDTSQWLAERARRVTAVDCAAPLLSQARARYGGLENLDFVLADAGQYRPAAPVHACFSRFGLTFFERPVQTLRHLHSWLEPGALLGSLVWRSRRENPWLDLAHRVVREVLPPVDEDAPNCGPGPFSMADREMVAAQLAAAGFHSVSFEPIDAQVNVGADVDEAVEFQFALGPAGEVVRHAEEQGHNGLTQAREHLRRALARFDGPHGINLASASWWVTARA
jgi:ubiquinone/menaquinone biosynthesis C-methylase UbiE